MVRWLLSDPPRHLVDVAKIVKEPVLIKPPNSAPQVVMTSPKIKTKFELMLKEQRIYEPTTFDFKL